MENFGSGNQDTIAHLLSTVNLNACLLVVLCNSRYDCCLYVISLSSLLIIIVKARFAKMRYYSQRHGYNGELLVNDIFTACSNFRLLVTASSNIGWRGIYYSHHAASFEGALSFPFNLGKGCIFRVRNRQLIIFNKDLVE